VSKSKKVIDFIENSDVAIDLKVDSAIFTNFDDFTPSKRHVKSSKLVKMALSTFKSMATSEFSIKSITFFDFDTSIYKTLI
jgi:hypothetical protein